MKSFFQPNYGDENDMPYNVPKPGKDAAAMAPPDGWTGTPESSPHR